MKPADPITLDYTLSDLYSADTEEIPNTVLIYYPLQFGHNNRSSSTKFIYEYTLQDQNDDSTSIATAATVLPQRYGFSAGPMPLVIPDVDTEGKTQKNMQGIDTGSAHHVDICRTFAQLHPDQQPILSFAKIPESIALRSGAQIAVLLPTDGLSQLPHLIAPDTHYELLSKRGLALSGLPTAASRVIDTVLIGGEDPTLMEEEILRMTSPFDQYPVPFIVKLPQSISGKGTLHIATEFQRAQAKALLTTKLGAMLRLLNQFNRHLCPCSVVLQDFVQGDVVGLSLFVTKKGRPYFVACCEQRFDSQGHWIGGSITYDRQDRLRETFAPITAQVAAFLHGRGYYGPAGVDVVTEQRSGEQLIIDLNVRVTGTFHLGPLRGHFTRRRMGVAALITCAFACSRDVFEESFAEEIQNGSLIVTGWGHDESRLLSHAAITVGAGDHDLLEECIQRTRAFGLD